jgi:hypothetical protein
MLESATPYGYYAQPSALTHISLFVSLLALIASITYSRKWLLALANILLVSLWISFAYEDGHWLERVDFGSVKVDDRPVPATVYMGHPTDMEAEAVALAHVPGLGDYFLDFDRETFREASRREFIGLHYGVWTLRPMRQGQFRALLPFHNLNEFRVPLAGGHVLTVEF